jgi:hypothetical protein
MFYWDVSEICIQCLDSNCEGCPYYNERLCLQEEKEPDCLEPDFLEEYYLEPDIDENLQTWKDCLNCKRKCGECSFCFSCTLKCKKPLADFGRLSTQLWDCIWSPVRI